MMRGQNVWWLPWAGIAMAFLGVAFLLFFLFTWAFTVRDQSPAVGFGSGLGAPPISEHTRTQEGTPVSGFARGDGFQINWQSQTMPTGAQPVDVLRAVQSRLQHLQKTNAGGDQVARAIWEVGKAIETLGGGDGVGQSDSGSSAGFVLPPEEK
jgi:hypothetical protein